MKKNILNLILCLAVLSLNAQNPTDPPSGPGSVKRVNDSWQPSITKDGVIDRVPHNHYLTPWQNIREADVLYKKRVWREIDTRQKQNFAMRYPGDEFSGGGLYIEIMMNAIKEGKVKAYRDDRFSVPITYDDVKQQTAGKKDTTYTEDPITGQVKMIIVEKQFNPDNVTKFRVKEDWIFDRNIGRMVCRIIGIAPYLDKYTEDGLFLQGSYPMFWLYYPELREVNVQYEVYNPENDVFRITWDDFFEKRMFSSFVTKSSINNPFQEDIRSYKQGVQALYESESIKETIFNKEHDLWVY